MGSRRFGSKRFRKSGSRIAMLAVVALVLAMLPASPALACCAGSDPDDSLGRLDIEAGAAYKNTNDAPMKLTLDMFENARDKWFKKHGKGRLYVYFDTNGDTVPEFRGKVRYVDGVLVFLVSGSGSRFEPLLVRRPAADVFKIKIPGDSPPNPATGVSIYFHTDFFDSGACVGGCSDEFPDPPGWLGPI